MKSEKTCDAKTDIKGQVRAIKYSARKKLFAHGNFITLGFGTLLLMIFISSAKKITSTFYRVFNMDLFTGKRTDVLAENGSVYLEILLCIMLSAPLFFGIMSLCIKIVFGFDVSFGSASSEDNECKRANVSRLFLMFDSEEKYCFSLFEAGLRTLCLSGTLGLLKFIFSYCETWVIAVVKLIPDSSSFALPVNISENPSSFIICFLSVTVKIFSGIFIIKVFFALLNYFACVEFIVIFRDCFSENNKVLLSILTLKKYIIYGFKFLKSSKKRLGYINRSFFGLAVLTLLTFGVVGLYALPYYLTVKSECFKTLLCENKELFKELYCTVNMENAENKEKSKKTQTSLLPADFYTVKSVTPFYNLNTKNKNI